MNGSTRRVLVLGAPRSGTTWVGSALGLTEGASYVHEPDGNHDPFSYLVKRSMGYYPVLEPGERAPEYRRLWEGAFGRWPARTLRDHVARRLYSGVPVETRAGASRGSGASLRLKLACRLAVPGRSAVRAGSVIVKSVHAPFCARWVYEEFRPRVVVVHRDVRSVMSSWVSLGWLNDERRVFPRAAEYASLRWGLEFPANEPLLTRTAAFVATLLGALLEGARENGWHVASHEILCEEPVTLMRELAETLGLDWNDGAERFVVESNREGKGYQSRRVAREQRDVWSGRLSNDQVREIEAGIAAIAPALVIP